MHWRKVHASQGGAASRPDEAVTAFPSREATHPAQGTLHLLIRHNRAAAVMIWRYLPRGVRMVKRPKITPEETAELQSLYAELPGAIAEAAEAARAEQSPSQPDAALEGDEKVDTIIKRIVQLTDESDEQ